ncbi:Disease resistance protein (TIR-NBS-LRR class) family [Euphorbia peplus]|nr:Disease resistance protein (TIR-NBS-LRR class) family [Euphorbia peplus]
MASRWTYEVFLSFRGNDIRKGFTGHLFAALCRSGINTFVDEEKLDYSEEIGEASLKGIKESRLALVLLAKDYAFSTWCLDELVQILKLKKADDVWPIFYDVDPSDVEEIKGSYELAFLEHRKCFEEGMIKEWKDALQQVSYFKGVDLSKHLDGHEANNIDHIVEEITRQVNPTTLNVAMHPVGIQSRAEEVISLMANESEDIRVVGLYGMGGIGKSTIAKEVYNLIHHKFVGSCFLENVREVSSSKGIVHLQRQVLSEVSRTKHEKIETPAIGLNLIVQKLRRSKVLLVLDDADERDHVHKILGNCDWLFPGSRVIVTTRMKDLLTPSELYYQYEVDKMDNSNSLCLLSLHAFGQNHPVDGYITSATKLVSYCGGIPLALEVLGSSLCGQSLAVWNSRLEKLRVIANDDIQSKLQISYDSLNETEQLIFLDIACFFVGYNKEYVLKILDGCGFFPVLGISTLIRRCLLKVGSNDKLVMHDLLRDMGRAVVRQENAIDPGERSRLWDFEDVIDVLTDKMGTNAVEGLALNKPGLKNTWMTKSFKKMKMLRLLQLNYVGLKGTYEHFSNKLRWLCWREFPLESMPLDLSLKNLIVLDMRHSSLKQFIESGQSATKLKLLNLSHSHKLVEIPDFEGCQCIEKLVLKDCSRLENIGDTIGLLSKLLFLNFQDCKSLKNLPGSIGGLKALERLTMSGCSKFEELPDSVGNLTHLTFLTFENCEKLRHLPGSIGELKSLQDLNLSHCSKLEILPESFGCLTILISLNLRNSENLKSLPQSIGNLKSLEKLDMSGCSKLEKLPESTGYLDSLISWNLQDCKNLENFPSEVFGLRSLQTLNMSGCSALKELPQDLGNMESLVTLILDETGINSLPESIRNIKKLEHLSLRECPLIFSPGNSSHIINILPYSLKELDLRYCNIMDGMIPDHLDGFSFLKDFKLCGNKMTSLPTSICNLPNLDLLHLSACRMLQSIPLLPSSVRNLNAKDCLSLESIDLRNFPGNSTLELEGCVNLTNMEGYFNSEPLEVEIVEKIVGSSVSDSIGNFSVRKIDNLAKADKNCPPQQAVSEMGMYSIFIPGSQIPTWFSHQNDGDTVSLIVPRVDPDLTITGVVTCGVYAWKGTSTVYCCSPHITITNRTKMFEWTYNPCVTFFSSDVEQDMSWICYWMFDNHKNEADRVDTGWRFKEETKQGDELEFSIDMGFGVDVKKCGIHLLCLQPTNHGSLSDELAVIFTAASRHQNRFQFGFPYVLRKENDGEISFSLQNPPSTEELKQWTRYRNLKLDESSSMNKSVYEGS